MAGITETHIMGIALERSALREHLHLAEGLPALQRVVKLEGTVDQLFGIEAAVGCKIDILQENAVHGGLDGDAGGIGLHHQVIAFGLGPGKGGRKQQRRRYGSPSH